ncbi:hypothetical protein ACA910_019175 [Epithemia clementina (nom. ined.)]
MVRGFLKQRREKRNLRREEAKRKKAEALQGAQQPTNSHEEAVESNTQDTDSCEKIKYESIMHILENLQRSIQDKEAYQCFKGLQLDVDNFVKAFCECHHSILKQHQSEGDIAVIVDYHCEVVKEFLQQKQEEMQAIDRLVGPLLDNGFEYKDSTESNQDSTPCFYVHLTPLYEESVGGNLASKLQDMRLECSPSRRKEQYKWWNDMEVTTLLKDALDRKLCNDRAYLEFKYWIGSLENAGTVDEDDAILLSYQSGQWSTWVPPRPPHNLSASSTTDTMKTEWRSTEEKHAVTLREEQTNGDRNLVERRLISTSSTLFELLEPDREYFVEVRSVSDNHGVSTECVSQSIRTKKELSLAKRIKQSVDSGKPGIGAMRGAETLHLFSSLSHSVKAKGIHLEGEPTVDCIRFVDVIPGFESSVEFGPMEDALVTILTGETGAGKSTHINAIINWLYGVELDDPFRFLLIDDSNMECTSSVTQCITVYRIRHMPGMPVDKCIVIVDSPGYADSRNLLADDFTTNAFRELFQQISHINCVGLVMKAYNERLTASTKYVIEKMLQLFDIGIKDNIVPICTFADHGVPTCLEGLKADNVSFEHHVKVQNSLFSCRYVRNQVDAGPMSAAMREERKLYWQIAYNGIASMFDIISNHMILRPLDQCFVVLDARRRLQETLQNVIHSLSETTASVANIREMLNILVNILGKAPAEKIVVEVQRSVKKELPAGVHVTLCSKCNYTCHKKCAFSNDADKAKCCAMGRNGKCMICPGHCEWKDHHNASYYWDVIKTTEEMVPQDLIKRWAGENGSHEKAILNALISLEKQQRHVVHLLNQAVDIQEELQAKSLRNNPRVALAYVESLIKMQEDRGASGEVLEALRQAKKQLRLQDEGKRQRDIYKANKDALQCIKDELERRSQLNYVERLNEETHPSDFYNQLLNKIPMEYRDKLPPPLKGNTGWFPGKLLSNPYPPFSESLKRTGQALTELLRMGVS